MKVKFLTVTNDKRLLTKEHLSVQQQMSSSAIEVMNQGKELPEYTVNSALCFNKQIPLRRKREVDSSLFLSTNAWW